MRFVYPAQLKCAAPDEIVVSFRDLPECLTSGDDKEEALLEAQDALEEAIAGRIDDGEPIPYPSQVLPGEYWVSLPADMAAIANVYLAYRYLAYRRGDFSSSELAHILGLESETAHGVFNPQRKVGVGRIMEMHGIISSELGVAS